MQQKHAHWPNYYLMYVRTTFFHRGFHFRHCTASLRFFPSMRYSYNLLLKKGNSSISKQRGKHNISKCIPWYFERGWRSHWHSKKPCSTYFSVYDSDFSKLFGAVQHYRPLCTSKYKHAVSSSRLIRISQYIVPSMKGEGLIQVWVS